MSFLQTKFKSWIARRLLTPPLADRFELHHKDAHGSSLVVRLETDTHEGGDVLAANLARQVAEETKQHLEGLEGRQEYVVRAFVGEQPSAEFAFFEHCSALSRAATQLAEPVVEMQHGQAADMSVQRAVAAMMAQSLRHTEALTVQVVELASRTGERDAAIIASQQKQLDRLEGRRFETHELLESLLSRSAEREFERLKFETEQNHKEQLFGTLMDKIVPGLAAAWKIPLPKGVAKPTPNEENGADEATTAVIKSLFDQLTPEIQKQITDELGDEGTVKLMQAFGYDVPAGATH